MTTLSTNSDYNVINFRDIIDILFTFVVTITKVIVRNIITLINYIKNPKKPLLTNKFPKACIRNSILQITFPKAKF